MKIILCAAAVLALCHMVAAASYNVTCFYDTASSKRGGSANFTINDLESSLQLCTHVVYGYVGIKPGNFAVMTLDGSQHRHFELVRVLKNKFRSVKFILSVGGDKDQKHPEKYMQLLESGTEQRQTFIRSATDILKKYQFDGLDLAYQFPRNKARKRHSKVGSAFKKLKKAAGKTLKKASKKANIDPKASIRRQHFTQFVGDLKQALLSQKMMLSLTVMPNVNSSWYFNVPAIMKHLDMVNLAAFDYSTPHRNPKQADYTAPLFAPPPHAIRTTPAYIDAEVNFWLAQQADPRKLNLGVAAYGRTWKITEILKDAKLPIVSGLDGPAPGDSKTHTPGFMGMLEVCEKVKTMTKVEDKKLGNYAYQPKDVKDSYGLLIIYDSPVNVAEKAVYMMNRSLGGMALFDLSLDDFRGKCGPKKFPLLQAIRSRLI